ncbi:MAG: DUF4962 domain-containing protein [Candidatus Hydrogenedentota bacterium]|nr:MAG: DUF4962 domain-containing protein [Candidatus Hydrogenedentota bacterium]
MENSFCLNQDARSNAHRCASCPVQSEVTRIMRILGLPLFLVMASIVGGGGHPNTGVDLEPPRDGLGYLPRDGATVSVNPPPLLWVPVPGVKGYDVEIHMVGVGTSETTPTQMAKGDVRTPDPVRAVTSHSPYCLHILDQPLPPGRFAWRYRVRWTDDGTSVSVWSRERRFEVPTTATIFPRPARETVRARIPSNHPRMFLRPEDLSRLRASRTRFPHAWAKMLEQADKVLTAPLMEEPRPWTGGKWNAEEWLKYYGQIVEAARCTETLAFAYLLTGSRQYGEAAKRWLIQFASWDPHGTTSLKVNDEQTMHIMFSGARAYSWIYDLLTDEERGRVRRMLAERAADAYRHLHEGPTPFEQCPYDSHNGRLWHFLGETALALYGEVPEAEKWLDYALTIFWGWYPIWGDEDGGWAEGLHYYTSYNEYALTWLQHARAVLQLPVERKPFYAHAADFPLYVGPPGAVMSGFGDFSEAPPSAGRGRVAAGFAALLRNPTWQWLAEGVGESKRFSPLDFLNAIAEKPKSAAPSAFPRLRVFRGAGWAVYNGEISSPQANLQLMMRASPMGNISHSHCDQNAIVLGAFGSPLLVNTGMRDYYGSPFCKEWYWHTRSHNSVLIDGEGQERGAHTTAQLVAWGEEGNFAWVTADATKAYGARVRNYRRYVSVHRENEDRYYLLVLDDIATTAKHVQVLYHARVPILLEPSTHSFALETTTAKLHAKVFADSNLEFSVSDRYSVPFQPVDARKTMPPPEWHLSVDVPAQPNTARVRVLTAMVIQRKGTASAPEVQWQTELGKENVQVTWSRTGNGQKLQQQVVFHTTNGFIECK